MIGVADLMGWALTEADARAVADVGKGHSASMLQIQQAAGAIGIALSGVAGSIDELSAVPGPKVVHLVNPAHFLVLTRADEEWAQIVDQGKLAVVPREKLEARYSGSALICEMPSEPGAPRLRLDSFHHAFGIVGVGQKIDHAFTVTNIGGQPLLLESKQDGG